MNNFDIVIKPIDNGYLLCYTEIMKLENRAVAHNEYHKTEEELLKKIEKILKP